ncbi:N-acetyl sugar amidotransferase, partial [Campylobacter jejuni]|nr:N-acetyl sugar amidotransferase [Campylobacter jejuni]
MKYCDYCVMPDTRPGLKFFKDENGKNICSACVNHKNKENIDYKARFKELEALCD